MILFHISPSYNDSLIGSCGLLQRFSQTGGAIWLVAEHVIAWALRHVPARHGLGVRGRVSVWRVNCRGLSPQRRGLGIWTVDLDVPIDRLTLLPRAAADE
jgi:hypothetical protein